MVSEHVEPKYPFNLNKMTPLLAQACCSMLTLLCTLPDAQNKYHICLIKTQTQAYFTN